MKGAMAWPFLRLYILALMFFSANAILNVFVPLRGHDLGATNTAIGIVMGAYMLTAMVFRPWAGQIIAKVGPIKILRIILIMNGIALIIYGFTELEGYFVARVMQGVCTAFFSMSLQLGIIDALPEKHRSEGISLYSLFSTLPTLIGPIIAVSLWNNENMGVFAIVMIVIALSTGIFGYSATFSDVASDEKPVVEKAPFNGLTVFGQFFKNPALFKSGLIMIIASIVFGAITTFIPLFTVQYGFANAGIYLTIQAIAVVLSRFYLRKFIPSDGLWHPKFMLKVLGILMLAAIIVAFGPYIYIGVFYGSAILIGIAQAMIYPTLTSYLSFVLPRAGRNMLLGLFIACADLGVSLGGAMMGPISDLVGFKWMYLICGMLVLIIMVYSSRNRKAAY
ncbi:staphylopine family metallophore export MFS transporter CntE [Mammaliicoccus lentus]|uniref:staphylopine family metallophore export MFS transporter CntE n=1 Tax=Mammaliicoccus lentus TaxID=42858 RepID=UPI00107216AA|nr:MFS transporter [Mammaliicoccus lentus]MBF0749353.1 MFS transporter [Mammaliicoccus lentus]TFU57757.1 MFS transporter [Mammaliicoccus lentus]